MRRDQLVRLTAGALAAVAVSACGGGNSGGSSDGGAGGGSSAGLSRADLDARANAICSAEVASGQAVPPPARGATTQQAAAYFDRIVPIIADATAKLAALQPQSALVPAWTRFVSLREQETETLEAVQHAADAGDTSYTSDLATRAGFGHPLAKAARAVGATACDERR